MSNLIREKYEPAIQPARMRFVTSPPLLLFLDAQLPARLPELFLIHFSARGVGMTEPVEGWIRRAGEKCQTLGLTELGKALCSHAQHEADHHLMMIEDTKALVKRWNTRHRPLLDADELIARPPSPGVLRYQKLHEDVIAGDAPFAQIAIEYEIEMLSVQFGPPMVERCTKELGAEVADQLSFVNEHIALDVGHTKFNEQQLEKVLQAHPEYLEAMVAAGSEALDAYAAFLNDCLEDARSLAAQAA